ncbi:uncharacterized mitochondrial protein-like protein [Tanacetum coccineum]
MTGNKCYLTEYEDYDGGFVSFGDGKGRIFGKGKIKTGTLDFENVYFCKELKYNLFSVSQICDKKNNVLFTDTECLFFSFDFKLLDESQVLLRVPRKDNIYRVDLKSVVLTKGLTCLFAKAIIDESNLWHRMLSHTNFKNMNKLMRGNLVRGLPSKIFENDHSCVACQKGKQHKASYKAKLNGVAERRNRTLIEAVKTMLVDSKLPTTFWAEAVNTACYVLNRVLVIKPHNKTPYELIRGRTPLIDLMKHFRCPVTILNTRDQLGKFDGNADEGFFVGYSVVSKAIRVFNKRTRIVEETLNIRFIKNAPNVTGNGPDWLFDVDYLSKQAENKIEPEKEYILIPICTTDPLISQDPKVSEEDAEEKSTEMDKSGASDKDGEDDQAIRSDTPVSTVGPSCTDDDLSSPVNAAEASNAFMEHLFEQFSHFKNAFTLPPVSNVTPMNDTGIFGNAYDDEDVGAEADLNNLETTMNVSPIPTTRIDKDHPKDQIIRDFNSAIQTRRMTKIFDEHAMVCYINKQRRTNHKDYQNCLFACFLSQMEPKKVIQALEDPSWIEAMQEELLQFQLQKMSSMGEFTFFLGLQVQQKKDGIFISQDKYVADILKKFDFTTVKTISTPMESNKALIKDEESDSVDVHLYRSMIGSLRYLTASKPDIMFAICACAILALKRIFRYLKGQPKLGLWYPRDSPFNLEAFSDSDYAGASLDKKSTIGGCQFLGKRCLWIQNQMLDYGFNFMNTKIFIDNESTICIVKNPVFHSKTKHIEIRHHFIRDSYEKKLIQVNKIHTDHNVIDLLTKAFDGRTCNIKQRCVMSQTPRQFKKGRDTKIPQSSGPLKKVDDEAVHKELGDRMERAATTASSLEAEQDSEFCDTYNMVAYLLKPEGSEDFQQIVDFLNISHIKFALTKNPTIYTSLIQQFWQTASTSTLEDGEVEITATIDGQLKTITGASLRRHLKLEDADGISSLPNTEIFEQLALMGYASDSDKLTF